MINNKKILRLKSYNEAKLRGINIKYNKLIKK